MGRSEVFQATVDAPLDTVVAAIEAHLVASGLVQRGAGASAAWSLARSAAEPPELDVQRGVGPGDLPAFQVVHTGPRQELMVPRISYIHLSNAGSAATHLRVEGWTGETFESVIEGAGLPPFTGQVDGCLDVGFDPIVDRLRAGLTGAGWVSASVPPARESWEDPVICERLESPAGDGGFLERWPDTIRHPGRLRLQIAMLAPGQGGVAATTVEMSAYGPQTWISVSGERAPVEYARMEAAAAEVRARAPVPQPRPRFRVPGPAE